MDKFFLLILTVVLMAHSCNGGSTWDQTKSWQNETLYNDGTVEVAGQILKVDLARTDAEHVLGLGGRTTIEDNQAMLFEFAKSGPHTFWMKGMLFPIDIVWLKDLKVVDMVVNAPIVVNPDSDQSFPVYTPETEANAVLELKAGWTRQYNLKIGDEIKLNLGN